MYALQVVSATLCTHGWLMSTVHGVPGPVWSLPWCLLFASFGVCGLITAAAFLWKHVKLGKHLFDPTALLAAFGLVVPTALPSFSYASSPQNLTAACICCQTYSGSNAIWCECMM